MTNASQNFPKARSANLLVKKVGNEVLVYDEMTDEAHCLNESAALVWDHCDGRTTVTDMAALLSEATASERSTDVVWLALDQLDRAQLLETGVVKSPTISRRDVARALGVATALAIPLVTSIVAPTAAQSSSCIAAGNPCTIGATPCCPGLICEGTCVP